MNKKKEEWVLVSNELPPEKIVVLTKIDDINGIRNVQGLMRFGKLYYTTASCEMYVYYTPTHWLKK